MQGINMSGGATNAVEFCTTLLGLPTPVEWLEAFTADINAEALTAGSSDLLEVSIVPFAFQTATKPAGGFDDEPLSDLTQAERPDEEEEEEYI